MAISVVPYRSEHVPAVRAFNARLDAAGSPAFRMGEAAPGAEQNSRGPLEFQHFVAVDHEGAVRGGYFIRVQPFVVGGAVHGVGHFSAPLSEGIVDKRYAAVGPLLVAHAVKTQPLLFAMGMGGMDRPLPRLLKSMGWHVAEVPFFFRVLNPARFLRNIGPLQRSTSRRLIARVAAGCGAGSLISLAQMLRTSNAMSGLAAVPVTAFESWADDVWASNKAACSFSAVRNAGYLQSIYPNLTAPYRSIRFDHHGSPSGWVNLVDCTPKTQSYFGAMKVTAIADGVAPANMIPAMLSAAVRAARDTGSDLLFSNQAHRHWAEGLRAAGFWQGPSNYLLALSKELVRQLHPIEEALPLVHFNRGDGDGLVNLTAQD